MRQPELIRQIETGAMSPDGLDCAFLWLYCLDGKPYTKYLVDKNPQARMPMVFALLRWDGTFGTIGGKVDPGESLRTALEREACEEANFWLSGSDEPEPLGTFMDSTWPNEIWHVHSFCLEVSYAELVELRAKASAVSHASPEVAGFALAPLGDYRPAGTGAPRGRDAFRQNSFCSTAKLELDALLAKLGIQHG